MKKSDIILSIHQKHIDKIFNKSKKFEFRKVKFSKEIEKVYIYSTWNICKVVGYFTVKKVHYTDREEFFKNHGDKAGLTKKEYNSYYMGRNHITAIEIDKVVQFKDPIYLEDLGVKSAPQSFIYISN